MAGTKETSNERKGESRLDVCDFKKLVPAYEANHNITPQNDLSERVIEYKREVIGLCGVNFLYDEFGQQLVTLDEARPEVIDAYYRHKHIKIFGKAR